jgi:SOS-response transcriptional repressor LexA
VHTGIAAAAKSDGRVGDGLITIQELEHAAKITLHNHDAYQLAAATLDPVATIGDVIIVSNYAQVNERNLVVVAFGDQLLARRYNEAEIHPHIAILTGQGTDPYAIPQPVIAPLEKLEPRKIVRTLFASSRLTLPPKDENAEFIALGDLTVVKTLLKDAKLFKVSGRSAEPIALDGQFILTQPVAFAETSLDKLDGRLVIAVDENGARYFKRFRLHAPIIVLESLNPDGTAAAEILSLGGEMGIPRLTEMLEVVGVLFELP